MQNNARKIWKFSRKVITFAPVNERKHRGVEQLVARQAHNLEVVRSSRASATNKRQMWSTIAVMRLYSFAFFHRLKKWSDESQTKYNRHFTFYR